jgi:DNA-binding MarR family transcriptional regulator
LADAVLLTRSGMTRLIDRLEKDGLIERGACPGDRRVIYAHLTDKGQQERERAWEVYRSEIDKHLGGKLSEAEATSLSQLLKQLIPNMPRCNS